jgi:glycosyltransferase involved in cell wall biosynthesis
MPRVTVVLPVHAQAAWVPRAAGSLLAQDEEGWELVVVDDGSPDDVAAALPDDPRIRLIRLEANAGLGTALNTGLDAAASLSIAYLPADDVWHRDHLSSLLPLLGDAAAARSGQELVHLVHRATPARWLPREVLETDRLDLLDHLAPVATLDRPTATVTDHPRRRHRALSATLDGGVNVFRRRYRVATPLRIEARDGTRVDEVARYARFRDRPLPPPGGLRILLAGELAYNPERVLALRERGHELLGLWIDDPLGFMTVGPLPFPGVTDVETVDGARAARPDIVYALLNWRAVPLARALLDAGLPVVFHYKEAPQRSIARGEWPMLADVLTRAQGVVLSSPEERAWVEAALPGRLDPATTMVLDGDLPKREWLDAEPSPRLSDTDGEVHTVLLGRAAGVGDALRRGLADRGIHLHTPRVEPQDWVRELSRYDAGWLHQVTAANGGDVRRATWDDLNLPARIPTLLFGGLPLILPRSAPEEVHAAQAFAERTGTGVLHGDLDDLAAQLLDRAAMERRRAAAVAAQPEVTFDHHADRLLDLLRRVAR